MWPRGLLGPQSIQCDVIALAVDAQLDSPVELIERLAGEFAAIDAGEGLALALGHEIELPGKAAVAQVAGHGVEPLAGEIHIVGIASALIRVPRERDRLQMLELEILEQQVSGAAPLAGEIRLIILEHDRHRDRG